MSVSGYRLIAKVDETRRGVVSKAQSIKNGSFYAIKCLKDKYKCKDELYNGSNELDVFDMLPRHRNIVRLEETIHDIPSGNVSIVFELLEGNMYDVLLGGEYFQHL